MLVVWTGLSRVIFAAAGDAIETDCQQILKKRTLKPGDVCTTTAGKLKADSVSVPVIKLF